MRVNFDENEFRTNTNAAIVDTNAKDGEFLTRPGGIIGTIFYKMNIRMSIIAFSTTCIG